MAVPTRFNGKRYESSVSQKARYARKRHYNAPSHMRRKIMSAPLCKELKEKYGIRCMPIRKDDKVMITRGSRHDDEGLVTNVYRKKWSIYVDKVTRENTKGEIKPIPLRAGSCIITELHMDKSRKKIIARKAEGRRLFKENMAKRDALSAEKAAAHKQKVLEERQARASTIA
eukprot:Protomagalhaensia_sp_Gyna_25__2049@NODE_20_length_7955_cov_303_925088_g13_i0_p8_GENE_NODE_20_length_7955_cov_303_925088_g13_i0NODE_20_length_7955_cov_303_925088_g13_i0_p8_ORF_typecomplete_len172_score35_19Ribosomal_L26/PF16906_5/5_1e39KOW/PF00467_29/5_2e05_NODE_20_length_7955_cov_303_925088_g13_i073727887